MERNHKIRRQIALGRLIEDAGLAELVGDDLALLFDGLRWLRHSAQADPERVFELWRQPCGGGLIDEGRNELRPNDDALRPER